MGSVLKVCGGGGVWVVVVGKPNLVKDFCPRLPLDLDLDFVLGLGQAFQYPLTGLPLEPYHAKLTTKGPPSL